MTRLLRVEGSARGFLTGVPLIGRVRSETAKRAAVNVLANMMIKEAFSEMFIVEGEKSKVTLNRLKRNRSANDRLIICRQKW